MYINPSPQPTTGKRPCARVPTGHCLRTNGTNEPQAELHSVHSFLYFPIETNVIGLNCCVRPINIGSARYIYFCFPIFFSKHEWHLWAPEQKRKSVPNKHFPGIWDKNPRSYSVHSWHWNMSPSPTSDCKFPNHDLDHFGTTKNGRSCDFYKLWLKLTPGQV